MKITHLIALFLFVVMGSILIGCSNETETKWKESALFESGGYTMIGEAGKIGFIYDDNEVTRFYPNKEQKYMWHLWGDKEKLQGDFKVIANHESNVEPITLLDRHTLGGSNNGADQHIPTMMSLPESGMWKLDAYVNDKLHGTVFVKVHEKQ